MSQISARHERIAGHGGVSLDVSRFGDGPPVLLLHGFPENRSVWRHQVEPLVRAGFSVLTPDLRGYGLSDKPAGRRAYRLDRLVKDVAALVRATGRDRAHVVGHDWGGVIAWAFAETRPELLDRLVILNAPHPRLYFRKAWRPSQFMRSWYVLFFQLPKLPERVLAARDFEAVRRMYRRLPARRGAFSEEEIESFIESLRTSGALTAALNYYRANATSFGRMRSPRRPIDAETLVVWGERDAALSSVQLAGIERVAPRARVVRLPDAGHWVQNEAPETVNELLIGFLRG